MTGAEQKMRDDKEALNRNLGHCFEFRILLHAGQIGTGAAALSGVKGESIFPGDTVSSVALSTSSPARGYPRGPAHRLDTGAKRELSLIVSHYSFY